MRTQKGRAWLVAAAVLLVVVGCGDESVLAPDSDPLGPIGPDGQPLAAIGTVEEICTVLDFESFSHGDILTSIQVPELELSFDLTAWPANSGLPSSRIYSTDTMAPPGDPFLAWAGSGATCPECLGLGNVLVLEDGAGFSNQGASDFGGTFFLDGFSQPDVRLRSVKAVSASFDASHQVWVDAEQLATSSAALGAVQELVPAVEPPITSFVELVILSSAKGGFDDLQLCRMMETTEDPGESEQGGEGCTVSFWKKTGNSAAWTAIGLPPQTPIEELLGDVPEELANPEQKLTPSELSIEQALRLRGGKVNRLVREAAAAYLNAASPDVSFDLTTAEVETLFRGALDGGKQDPATKTLAGFNHQVCPLD
ncbi:MAG: hypothetical protein M8862_08645 [marine benthic group bacterium]|jgi:hypothetical protein|nr:hypothetical protein [Gemmatimonadota bacterium]